MRVRRQGWQCGSASQRFLKNATARRISGMLTVIIVIHLMLVLALIGVVMLQKSEGGGLISSTSGFLSSRGTANVCRAPQRFWLQASSPPAWSCRGWQVFSAIPPRSSIPAPPQAKKRPQARRSRLRRDNKMAGCSTNCRRAFRRFRPGPDRRPALSQHLADRRYRNRSNGALPALLGWNASPISNRRPPPELRSCLKILI